MLRPGKDKGLATPLPLGLAALGTTTFLMGVAAIFQSSAFADIYNSASLEEIVPVGESKAVRARVEHEEMERIRRIHPTGQMERDSEARRA